MGVSTKTLRINKVDLPLHWVWTSPNLLPQTFSIGSLMPVIKESSKARIFLLVDL